MDTMMYDKETPHGVCMDNLKISPRKWPMSIQNMFVVKVWLGITIAKKDKFISTQKFSSVKRYT